jgi:hypothetical protein
VLLSLFFLPLFKLIMEDGGRYHNNKGAEPSSFDLYSSPLHLCRKQILDITYWIGNMLVDLWVVSAAGQWITKRVAHGAFFH